MKLASNLVISHKKLLICLGLMLGVVLQAFYFYQKAQVQQAKEQLVQFQKQATYFTLLRSKTAPLLPLTTSLETLLEQTAQDLRLPLTQVTREGEQVEITLQVVSFEQLINWLGLLQRQYGIRVVSLEIDFIADEGKVAIKKLLVALPSI